MKLIGAIIACGASGLTALSVGGLLAYDVITGSNLLEPRTVLVEFRNYDNTFLWKDNIPYGTDAEYGGNLPQRPDGTYNSYTFSSWDKPLNRIQEDTIFYAEYYSEPLKLTVTFQNYDRTELYVDRVSYGNTAKYYGKAPTRPDNEVYSYRFIGWDRSLENIVEDTIITAQYESLSLDFTVKFLNYDGTELYIDKVPTGGTAEYQGLDPIKIDLEDREHDYVFVGWDKGLENVTADFETTAVFEKVATKYRVDFYNYDNSLLYTDYVPEGEGASFYGKTPTKPSDDNYTYVFDGWNKPIDKVTSNLSVVAKYQKRERQFYAIFHNGDGSILYTAGTNYGGTVTYGGVEPTKESDEQYDYYFEEWDRPLTNITQDIDIYPIFYKTLRIYPVTFVNYDGTVLYETMVQYGDTAVYFGDTPVKPATPLTVFKFDGWDKDTHDIKGETVFVAQFIASMDGGGGPDIEMSTTVFFYSHDGTLLDGDDVTNKHADYQGPTDFTREPQYISNLGYRTFNYVGWDIDVDDVDTTQLFIYTFALYETNYGEKNVVYRNPYTREIIYEEFVPAGGTSSYKGEMYDFLDAYNGFCGWSQPLTDIQESMTVYPVIMLGGL